MRRGTVAATLELRRGEINPYEPGGAYPGVKWTSQVVLGLSPHGLAAVIERLVLDETKIKGVLPESRERQFVEIEGTRIFLNPASGVIWGQGTLMVPSGYPNVPPTEVALRASLDLSLTRPRGQVQARALFGLAQADVELQVDVAELRRRVHKIVADAGLPQSFVGPLLQLSMRALRGQATRRELADFVERTVRHFGDVRNPDSVARKILDELAHPGFSAMAQASLGGLHRPLQRAADLPVPLVGALSWLTRHILGGTVHVQARSTKPTGSTGSQPYAHTVAGYGLGWQPAGERYRVGAPMLGGRYAHHGERTGVDIGAGAALHGIDAETVSQLGMIGALLQPQRSLQFDLQAQASLLRRTERGNLVRLSLQAFRPLGSAAQSGGSGAADPSSTYQAEVIGERSRELTAQPAGRSGVAQPQGSYVLGSLTYEW